MRRALHGRVSGLRQSVVGLPLLFSSLPTGDGRCRRDGETKSIILPSGRRIRDGEENELAVRQKEVRVFSQTEIRKEML